MFQNMAVTNADAAGYMYKSYTHHKARPHLSSFIDQDITDFNPKEPCVCAREDFIILAEFSEITGPIPILTIPSYIEENDEVEIDAIIMRLMSIDYQVNAGDQFSMYEDVQILRSNVTPNLNAYVHYMSLHDLKARGFVRPLCIAYLSADLKKLDDIFPELREKFVKLSRILKYNNCQWFLEEVLKILHEVTESQEKYFYLKQREEEGILPLSVEEIKQLEAIDISQLVQQFIEYSHIEHVIKPYLDDEALKEYLDCWKCEFMCKEQTVNQVGRYLKKVKQDLLNHFDGSHLCSVLCLSPWGVAAALWELQQMLCNYHHCRLEVSLCMFPIMDSRKILMTSSEKVSCALTNEEYLQLLSNMVFPFSLSQKRISEIDSGNSPAQDVLQFTETRFLTSGTEGSSSYHSAPESLSDVLISAEISNTQKNFECQEVNVEKEESSGSDSYVDISEDCLSSASWNIDGEKEAEELAEPLCVWGHDIPPNVEGSNIVKFFHKFSKVAHHVIYSIWIGRTVVFAGEENSKSKVSCIIYALKPLVPVKDGERVNVFSWHHGILVSSHIKTHKLIGVCVPERLSVYDMISDKDKNNVTILDVTTEQLFGPAYSGKLLAHLEIVPQYHHNDQGVLLYLKSVSLGLQEKLFIFRHMPVINAYEKLKRMDIEGCDTNIIKYLDDILPPL